MLEFAKEYSAQLTYVYTHITQFECTKLGTNNLMLGPLNGFVKMSSSRSFELMDSIMKILD